MPDPYASIQDVRSRGITPEQADDATVQAALERATKMVDIFTGRDFLKREKTYNVDGDGTESLFLEDRPIVEVLELVVDEQEVAPDRYVLYGEAGYIRLDNAFRSIFSGFPGVFPSGSQNVMVHGFFGFEEVPLEANEATILLAIEFLRTRAAEADVGAGSASSTRNAIGVRSVKIDEISVDFEYPSDVKAGSSGALSTGLPKADALLTRFRRQVNAIAV